jgi:hypothetical protein
MDMVGLPAYPAKKLTGYWMPTKVRKGGDFNG